MEWVTTTGTSVEEAKERALDQLGVSHDDAEFEVLEEPKKGLFGRQRGEARVRARVRPTQARQKVERRDRRREKGDRTDKAEKGNGAEGGEAAKPQPASRGGKQERSNAAKPQGSKPRTPKPAQPKAAVAAADDTDAERGGDSTHKEQHVDAHQVGEEARRFMVGLLEAFGAEGQVELAEDGDDLELRVVGQELGLLVGPRGSTLQAVQDLTRVASQRRLGDHDTRLRVDVGGYRERRRVALGGFAEQMANEVISSGVARVLEPMSSADRKIIHDTLSGMEGIATRSEGDDPHRRVIIAPANG